MKRLRSNLPPSAILLCLLLAGQSMLAQGADVTARMQIEQDGKGPNKGVTNTSYAVLWLTSLSANGPQPPTAQPLVHYRLVQHDKQFNPHLLVVPVGTSVDFPNHDPFYHNVFSLFNGKRFDLGLYESGSDRSVRFDHEGISFIFCNIHPEMGAVVIALHTPYFAVASPAGNVTIRDVPPGTYDLRVWAEGADPKQLDGLGRRVEVAAGQQDLGSLLIKAGVQGTKHKNKFGEDYPPDQAPPY
jgi:plastocyanin